MARRARITLQWKSEKAHSFSDGMNRIAPARGAAAAAPSHLTGHVLFGTMRQHVNKYHRFAGLPWAGQGVKPMPFIAHVLLNVIAALCGHGHLTVSLASSHRTGAVRSPFYRGAHGKSRLGKAE